MGQKKGRYLNKVHILIIYLEQCSKLFALKCIAYVFGIQRTNANPQIHKQHSKTTEREMKITNNKGMLFPVIQVITKGLNLPNEPYEIGENV